MSFGKKFLEKNSINISNIYKSNKLLPIQYQTLAPKYIKKGPVNIPHSYSNKYNRQQMRNTLELLHELYRK